MARHRLLVAVLLTLAFVQSGRSQSGVTRVWAVDDGEKVKRDDLSHWAGASADNAVWDGRTIRLFGARNEIVAFQLQLEARGSGAMDVNVTLDSLAGPGYLIANRSTNDDPFDYRGRHIELFLEQYINVTQRSMSGGIATWGDARPLPDAEHLGWIPDALVPFQATPGTADWVGGAPFAIGPGRNQGVWIDITIPRDAPPGTYRATVRVSEQGRQTFAIPLELSVYSFTLPDSTHFHNTFYIENKLLTRHPGVTLGSAAYWQMFQKYMHLAHRHRMDLTDGRRTLDLFDANMKDYYTGARYTNQFGYDGPGRGVGNATYSIGTYDQPNNGHVSSFDPATREGWYAASDAWESWFRANAPDVVRFKYMVDEPDQDTARFYPTVRERASWIHENPGPGKDLGVFCTVKLDPRLEGSVNFWSLTGQSGYDPGDGIRMGYRIQQANELRARGDRVGIYNGTRPSFGIFEWIDNVATDPRVNSWIAFKYHVDQFFLWETGLVYNQSFQEKQNPWRTPYQVYSNGRVKWGHGTVLYTGNDALFPDESRGIDGPIASIRIKNWRRGQQDYEYLLLARQAGLATGDLVDAVVPAAFDDYQGPYTSAKSQAVFAQRGFQFDKARRQLGERIELATKTGTLPTGTFSVTPTELPAGGGTVTLTWTSTAATVARIDNGIGQVSTSGSTPFAIAAPTTFTLTLVNETGSISLTASVAMPPPPPPPQPTGTVRVSPRNLPYGGGTVNLTWSTSNAAEVWLDNGIGPVQNSGAMDVAVTKSTVFTMTMAGGPEMVTAKDSVLVERSPLTPKGTFTISPSSLAYGGGSVTLAWNSENATSAKLDHGIGEVPVSGSYTIMVTGSTAFSLSLINGPVTTMLQASVRVDTLPPMPEGSFTVTPSSLPYGGGDVVLSWTSTNAIGAVIDQNIGDVPLNGSRTVRVTSPTIFTLTLSSGVRSIPYSVRVAVDPTPPEISGSFAVAPSSLPSGGGDVVLNWSSQNAVGAVLDNGIGPVSLSGSRAARVDRSTTFTLTLTSPTDTLVMSQDVLVEQVITPPQGVIAAVPSYLPEGGGEVTLLWTTQNAARVSIDHGIGQMGLNGSMRVYVGSTTQFVMTVDNGAGSAASTAGVSVASSTVEGRPNLVRNPDFEIGRDHWNFQSDGIATFVVDTPGCASGRAAHFSIQAPGNTVQFYQSGLPLDPGATYRLQFDARSNNGHDMDLVLHKHWAPFTPYGLHVRQLDLEPAWKNFAIDFVASNFDMNVSDARLRFWFGPYSDAGDDYDIDNVVLAKLRDAAMPVGIPMVSFPSAGSEYMPTSMSVTWNRVEGASHYHLQLAQDSLFSQLMMEDSTIVDTVARLGPLGPGQRYFLRVRGDSEVARGMFSPLYAFVTEPSSAPPTDYVVEQNYPNPFNAGTEIRYSLRSPINVDLRVYDILGREIARLVEGIQPAGIHRVTFSSQTVSSGTYFYVFKVGDFRDVRKMVVLK